jgi:hypothetical protein
MHDIASAHKSATYITNSMLSRLGFKIVQGEKYNEAISSYQHHQGHVCTRRNIQENHTTGE